LGLEGGFDVEGDICDFIELNNLWSTDVVLQKVSDWESLGSSLSSVSSSDLDVVDDNELAGDKGLVAFSLLSSSNWSLSWWVTAGAAEEEDWESGEGGDWGCDDDETGVIVFEMRLDDESVDEEDAEDDMSMLLIDWLHSSVMTVESEFVDEKEEIWRDEIWREVVILSRLYRSSTWFGLSWKESMAQ
jgi:hypothetical protein